MLNPGNESFALYQNYPNPFNPTTKISFQISEKEHTILEVYNILGQRMTTLINEVKGPGSYEVTFDAANLPSGIYFYKLHSGEFVDVDKMVLLK